MGKAGGRSFTRSYTGSQAAVSHWLLPSHWPRPPFPPHLQAEVKHRSEVRGHGFGVGGHQFIQHLQSVGAQLLK